MVNKDMIYRGPYEVRIRRVRLKNSTVEWSKPLREPFMAANIAYNLSKELDQETMHVIGLDNGDRVLYIQELYRGTTNGITVRPIEFFRAATIENATQIIIFHNHPSGITTPSRQDIETLTRLVESAKILGIEVQDFMIVTDDPNLFWSAQIAVGGKLMAADLSKMEIKDGSVDRNLLSI